MKKTLNIVTTLAVLISMSAMPVIADDEVTGAGMGETTRTTGPTGTPGTTGEGGSASREGLVTEPNYPKGISAVSFVEEATEKNHAIIDAAELALAETNTDANPEVRQFAQKLVETHKQLNRELAELAEAQQIEMSDSATLVDRAQSIVLSVKDDGSFLEAFANNQVADHQELLDLFERAAATELGKITQYAKNTLPILEKHLEKARTLDAEIQNKSE
ncbi:DUF4142 domain-containing protein [uncultured Halopseudomonas sp.]|uniref:DUF4142 domain-containing protein n=1 Tax=uncultured Halopseudomonas sp. TaxID=2901193 RepID=UPI0030ED35C5|tara:strand:+ start:17488 stop:18141 length:654 start_codon:yes stop_codon:yes gene_type:complete